MITTPPPHEVEAPVERQAPAEKSLDPTSPAEKSLDQTAPAQKSLDQTAPAPASPPHSDEKVPVEPQLAPYSPKTPASPDPTIPPTPHTATFSSTDTDKIALPTAMDQQYPHDPSQHSPAPVYPDHTGSTSPHQQYTIQPDHAYGQPGYDQNSYYAQQQQPRGQPGVAPQQYQTATPLSNLNRSPAPVDCPSCGVRAMTSTNFETGNTTHAWAFGACIFLCLGCIPYLISSTKDVQHKCSKCGTLLATWHRSGNTDVHMHV